MVKCAGLTEELEAKDETLVGKDKHLNDVHERLDSLHRDFDDMVNMNHQLEANLCQVRDEATRGVTELADLKEAHEELMAMHAGAQEQARQAQLPQLRDAGHAPGAPRRPWPEKNDTRLPALTSF